MMELRRLFKCKISLRVENGAIAVYIEDWYLTARSKEYCDTLFAALVKFLTDLGLIVHPKKWTAPFQRFEYTGVIVDSLKM